jgi:hypothetical protein
MFTYKVKSFKSQSNELQEDDDDVVDLFNNFPKKGSKRKSSRDHDDKNQKKRVNTLNFLNIDDVDDDVCVIEDSRENSAQFEAKSAAEKLLASLETASPELDALPRVTSELSCKDTEAIATAKRLLSKIGSVKNQTATSTGSLTGSSTCMPHLDLSPEKGSSNLILPSVKRANQRAAQSALNMIDITADALLDTLVGKAQNNANSSTSAKPMESSGPKIRIKTRLNGSHEWKFKIGVSDPFEKVWFYSLSYLFKL